MGERTKAFGAGAIVSPIILSILVSAGSFVGLWASKVPALEATFKTEVKHLSKALTTLTNTAVETNNQLKSYTESQARTVSQITETLVLNKYKIEQLQEMIEKMEDDHQHHQWNATYPNGKK